MNQSDARVKSIRLTNQMRNRLMKGSGISSVNGSEIWASLMAPITLYRIATERSDFHIGLGCQLRHCNSVRAASIR
jgi:hypothetical protein